ncbi:MAG: hypothetical protein SH847_07725, partial [Roseiflexaceae bacterium]|nr:hypothetical protein [Roseiflexaceae bacterium]
AGARSCAYRTAPRVLSEKRRAVAQQRVQKVRLRTGEIGDSGAIRKSLTQTVRQLHHCRGKPFHCGCCQGES